MDILLDFETYCDLDLSLVGAFKYATHPSCKVLYISYKAENDEIAGWSPANSQLPEMGRMFVFRKDNKLKAFNATFDYLIWN